MKSVDYYWFAERWLFNNKPGRFFLPGCFYWSDYPTGDKDSQQDCDGAPEADKEFLLSFARFVIDEICREEEGNIGRDEYG